jgi:hypothetical protein
MAKRERWLSIRVLPERFALYDRLDRAAKTLRLSRTEAALQAIERGLVDLEAEAASFEAWQQAREREREER